MARAGSVTQAPAEDVGRAPQRRRRAPRRSGGRRAQLTVPEDMWRQLADIAEATGTTPNDALVRIAEKYLEDRERALALARLAEQRWDAFATAAGRAGGSSAALSEDELVKLSRAFRDDG